MRFNHGRTLTEAGRAAALVVACVGVALAASRHVQASLVAEHQSIRPGEPFWVGLRLKMEPGWHTYWKNPGDSGLPTRIKWTLPDGFEAGPIDWPYPEPFSQGPVTSYGYEHEVLLPVAITPPASLLPGRPVTLAARVDWLECQEACLPGRADLSLTLPVTPGPTAPAVEAAAFAATRQRLPGATPGWTFEASEKGGGIELVMRPPKTTGALREAYFFPEEAEVLDHAAPQTLAGTAAAYRLTLKPARNAGRAPARLKGVLVVHDPRGTARALRVDAAVANKTAGGVAPPATEER
jgi:thiol:disulfide interchange protein DsbD